MPLCINRRVALCPCEIHARIKTARHSFITIDHTPVLLLKLYKAPLPTGNTPGRARCAAKPLKEPLPLKQGPLRFLVEALGFGLRSRLVSMYRGSNPPPLGCLHVCFCLGSCRAFKGPSPPGSSNPHSKPYFHTHNQVRFPGPESQ